MIDEEGLEQFGRDMTELSKRIRAEAAKKEDHSVSCFFQMLTICGGLLLLSLSIAVWVNWII